MKPVHFVRLLQFQDSEKNPSHHLVQSHGTLEDLEFQSVRTVNM